MSDKQKTELLEMLKLMWVRAERAVVKQLLPEIVDCGMILIRDRDQFRVIEPDLLGYFSPQEVVRV